MNYKSVKAIKQAVTLIEAAEKLLQNNLPHFDKELQTMAINPDITGCSKSVTINGIVVTISFEREEEELY